MCDLGHCSGCGDVYESLNECLRCDGLFCVHCMAWGFCEQCIEDMGLIVGNIEEFIELHEQKTEGSITTWTPYERGVRKGLELGLKLAKGEQLP